VLLGLGGAAIGWSISKVHWLEALRGGIAAWLLLCFGLVYSVWGLIRVRKDKQHKHFDVYEDGSVYVYEHQHGQTVMPGERHKVTPWVMFLIFFLGPCEPMIPLLYFPAAKSSWSVMIVLIMVYTICTLCTMLVMVFLGHYGLGLLKVGKMERYMHPLGGLSIVACGLGMLILGW
jgi:hypothetical protein